MNTPRAVLVFVVALSLGSTARLGAQTDALPAAPDELFLSRCVGCHLPPDARFAVERAWLEQVLDTA